MVEPNYIKIDKLVEIKNKTKIDFDIDNYNFNLSMLKFDNEILIAFRNSNVFPYSNAAGKFSAVYTGKLLNNKIENLNKINFHGYSIPLWDKYNGMEDPRLFEWQEDLWCLFVRPNYSITRIFMVMLNLRTGKNFILDDPENRPFTKNWMPYVDDERLYFVVDASPFSLYEFLNGSLKLIKNNSDIQTSVSGGSNIISFDDKLIAIVHGKDIVGRRRYYWHSIAQWDKNFDNMRIGKKFVFEKNGIEFCLSAIKNSNSIQIPYSVDDDGVSIIEIKDEQFRKLL